MVTPRLVRRSPLRFLFSRTGVFLTLCVSALLLLTSRPLASRSVLSEHLQFPQSIGCYPDQRPSHYRQRLATIRPLDTTPHSKTLGVAGRLYVVNLPTRTDRRERMLKIEKAMDLELTWHNATDLHSKEVTDIRERVRWWRDGHRVNASLPKADPSPFLFKWADDVNERTGLLGLSGSDLWTDTFGESPLSPLPPPPSPDNRPPVLDTYEEQGKTFGNEEIRLAQYACWHSHYRVLRRIAEGKEDVAIVFEDDIDMEWDLERRLREIWGALPDDWDMVMIGHCQSSEWKNPPLKGSPYLRPAFHTLCAHGYAVTRRTAQHMVRRMRSESFAYSRNVDHAFQHFKAFRHNKVFSIYPPLVIQTYESASDITPNRPYGRVEWLADSVLERIALEEDSVDRVSS